MVIKSVALYTTPGKVCNSIVQKDSCWFQWGLEQSQTQRVFTGSRTIPVFARMIKLALQIINASMMWKYQLHLLDQRKSITKGMKLVLLYGLLCIAIHCTSTALVLVSALSNADHPSLQRVGRAMRWAWTWIMYKAVLAAGRENYYAGVKHKGIRLPLEDNLVKNKQTNSYGRKILEKWISLPCAVG